MKKIIIKQAGEAVAEYDHTPETLQAARLDTEAWNKGNHDHPRAVEVYEPPTVGTLEQAKAAGVSLIKAQASKRIYEAAPIYKQINAALGLESEQTAAAIAATIEAHRATVALVEFGISSASTPEEVQAVIDEAVWP